jgi:hypothetical protein
VVVTGEGKVGDLERKMSEQWNNIPNKSFVEVSKSTKPSITRRALLKWDLSNPSMMQYKNSGIEREKHS